MSSRTRKSKRILFIKERSMKYEYNPGGVDRIQIFVTILIDYANIIVKI